THVDQGYQLSYQYQMGAMLQNFKLLVSQARNQLGMHQQQTQQTLCQRRNAPVLACRPYAYRLGMYYVALGGNIRLDIGSIAWLIKDRNIIHESRRLIMSRMHSMLCRP